MPLVNYYLPTTVKVDGIERAIRSDYRAALDVCIAMQDDELKDYDKIAVVLDILYSEIIEPQLYTEALAQALNFLSCGTDDKQAQNIQTKTTDLIFWQFDFDIFVPALNRVAGRDIRGMEYLHWWSFVSMFQEIGDCFFSRVMAIREAKSTGRKLTDEEKAFWKKHKDTIDPRLRQMRARDLDFMRDMQIIR